MFTPMTRLFFTALLSTAVALGLTTLVSTPSVAATKTAATAKRHEPMAKKVYAQHVKTRKVHGKRALKKNSCLQAYARAQAKRQATKHKMYHQNLRPALHRCEMKMVGENVAYGFTNAAKVQRAWLNSPPHRKNMLNGKFNRIGVGVYKSKTGTFYYAVVFGQK